MANRMRAWVEDVLVFAAFTLLDAALMAVGLIALGQFLFTRPLPTWLVCWWWVCAAPAFASWSAHWGEPWESVLFWSNPFIYGLMWWGAWRLWKLFRTKPSA